MHISGKALAQSCTLVAVMAFTSLTAAAQTKHQDSISLSFPESVIAETVSAVLPIKIDANSKKLQGDINIISISELELTPGHLSCHLQLAGKNLAFVTEIAGHEIKLKVGEVSIDARTDSEIRYDRAKETMFIKPVVKDSAKSGSLSNGDIGQALIALLNGREFPIKMKNLDPLIAEAGTKTITINTSVTDIAAEHDRLLLKLAPKVTAKTTAAD